MRPVSPAHVALVKGGILLTSPTSASGSNRRVVTGNCKARQRDVSLSRFWVYILSLGRADISIVRPSWPYLCTSKRVSMREFANADRTSNHLTKNPISYWVQQRHKIVAWSLLRILSLGPGVAANFLLQVSVPTQQLRSLRTFVIIRGT